MSENKFYRTVLEVEILTDRDVDFGAWTLADIGYEITEGDSSGEWEVKQHEELTPVEMAKALMEQGSDPGFFGLAEDGSLEQD